MEPTSQIKINVEPVVEEKSLPTVELETVLDLHQEIRNECESAVAKLIVESSAIPNHTNHIRAFGYFVEEYRNLGGIENTMKALYCLERHATLRKLYPAQSTTDPKDSL